MKLLNRSAKPWVGLSIIMLFGFQSASISYHNVAVKINEPHMAIPLNRVGIYVNASIWNNISAELVQYVIDVQTAGFNVSIFNWTDPTPAIDMRAINLRSNLTLEYANGLIGAVLIGEMPYALFEANSIIYPCDLFMMDLDGQWIDSNLNTYFDQHILGAGDLYPEIFIGRINPYNLVATDNATDLLVKYFQRNHEYRTSTTQIHNNSLMWIDDDWEAWSHEWKADLDRIYSNVTLVNNSVYETNKPNYLLEINKTYDFAHVFLHSDSARHYLKVGGTFKPEHEIQFLEIKDLDDKVLFYNLYCCYAADFTQPDDLATHYLFSSNYTLGIYGSSRTGGFLLNQYLYEPLNASKTLGQAFQEWWSNDIYEPILNHGPSDLNMTGNTLLGDPTLRLYRPPPSSQPSQPTLTAPVLEDITPDPSLTGNISLNWTDVFGATGYEVYRATTTITSIAGLTPIVTATTSQYLDNGLTNGTYYYVVVAKNTLVSSPMSNCEAVTVTILPSNNNSGTQTPPFNLMTFLIQNIIPISIAGVVIISGIVIKVKRKSKAKVSNEKT